MRNIGQFYPFKLVDLKLAPIWRPFPRPSTRWCAAAVRDRNTHQSRLGSVDSVSRVRWSRSFGLRLRAAVQFCMRQQFIIIYAHTEVTVNNYTLFSLR